MASKTRPAGYYNWYLRNIIRFAYSTCCNPEILSMGDYCFTCSHFPCQHSNDDQLLSKIQSMVLADRCPPAHPVIAYLLGILFYPGPVKYVIACLQERLSIKNPSRRILISKSKTDLQTTCPVIYPCVIFLCRTCTVIFKVQGPEDQHQSEFILDG
jgi:hypothetical protein